MKELSDGILRRQGAASPKLSWGDTAREMAVAEEDWSVWDPAVADGLDEIPWERAGPHGLAEQKPKYETGRRSRTR